MQKYAILQSGLLSFLHSDLVLPKKDPIQDTVNAILQGKNSVGENSLYHYDKTISDLYGQYKENPRLLLDFSYREKILIVALRAFSGGTFDSWISMQKNSEFFTMMHKEFIIDTLRYICTGRRGINIETWPFLLEVRQATIKDRDFPFPYEKYLSTEKEYSTDTATDNKYGVRVGYGWDTDYGVTGDARLPVTIRNDTRCILGKWTSNDDGFSDLIQTLNAIFGIREVS